MDTLVVILIAILLPTWILGTLLLSFLSESSVPKMASNSITSSIGTDLNDAQATEKSAFSEHPRVSRTPDQARSAGELPSDDSAVLDADQALASNQKFRQLERLLEQKDAQIEIFRQSMAASPDDDARADDRETIDQLNQQVAQISQQRDDLTRQLQQSESTTSDAVAMSDDVLQLTQQRDQLQTELAAARKDSQRSMQLSKKIESLALQLNSQSKELKTLNQQLVAFNQTKQSLQKRIDALTTGSTPATDVQRRETPLEFRQWISSKGSKAELAFVGWDGDHVIVVNRAGKKFRMTLDRFSPSDQDFVNHLR